MTEQELNEWMLRLLEEREKRWMESFRAQEKAVITALQSAEKAVSKAEIAAEKRFDSVNEFRAQLADQAGTFMPRGEAEIRFSAMSAAISDLRTFRDSSTGIKTGVLDARAWLVAGVGVVAGLIGIVLALVR